MDQMPNVLKETRTDVLGVPVNAVDMRLVIESVRAMLENTETHVIAAVNPEKVINAQRDPDLLRSLENASLVVPDGIGIVMAARLLRKGRMARVPGSDLMPEICRLAATEGHSIFLYGAKPNVVLEAARLLKQRYPGLNISGTQHGYTAEDEMEQLVQAINSSGAAILFVALGSPRQELWMDRHRDKLLVRVCQGVGGTFDAICGNPKRAPKIFQKLYLEWLYRLVSQPQRAHRQLALPRFAAKVLRQVIINALSHRPTEGRSC